MSAVYRLCSASEPELQAPLGRQESSLDLPAKTGQVLGTRDTLDSISLILGRGSRELDGAECRLSAATWCCLKVGGSVLGAAADF